MPANARIGNNYNSEPNESDDLDLLVDEAKTMFSIGGYHENIVNLQGIGYEVDQINKCISTVRKKNRITHIKNELIFYNILVNFF